MPGDDPISETDAIFARAYAAAIKSKFNVDIGEHNVLFTSPTTLRGIPAGDFVYTQMTNYLIYRYADSLQYTDNPSYTGASAGSYIQQLESYIRWIKPNGNPSQVVAARMAVARDNATDSNDNYFDVLGKANTEFKKVKDKFPGLGFWEWAAAHFPDLAEAERIRARAQAELLSAMALYFGTDAPLLAGYLTNLTNATTSVVMLPKINQEGLTDDRDLINDAIQYANTGKKPDPASITQATIPIPYYTVTPDYSSTVQSWITASGNDAPHNDTLDINIEQGRKSKWEDFGFKDVKGGSNGFWPFFHATVFVNGKEEKRELNTKGREDKITLKLAMIGTKKFDVNGGDWDVPDVKTKFPIRLPAAPEDVLGPKFAKITHVLAGYDVQLQVEFASEFREDVNKIYEEVKSSKGSLTVFGYRVSAATDEKSGDHVVTKFDDVKWNKSTGLLSLAPSKGQVYPTLLGAVAQRFD